MWTPLNMPNLWVSSDLALLNVLVIDDGLLAELYFNYKKPLSCWHFIYWQKDYWDSTSFDNLLIQTKHFKVTWLQKRIPYIPSLSSWAARLAILSLSFAAGVIDTAESTFFLAKTSFWNERNRINRNNIQVNQLTHWSPSSLLWKLAIGEIIPGIVEGCNVKEIFQQPWVEVFAVLHQSTLNRNTGKTSKGNDAPLFLPRYRDSVKKKGCNVKEFF